MRKDRKQHKKEQPAQLTLFSRTGEPMDAATNGIGKPNPQGVELSSRLEKQQTLTRHLLERVVDYPNLQKAYKQVNANKGSSGVDGMSIKGLREWLGQHHEEFTAGILAGTYQVEAVRKVEIPKPTGGKRMLGIPTVKDRLVQQSIHQVLSTYYEPHFSENSYGFRPNRSAHQAIKQAVSYVKSGKEWVVDLDLEKFFDKINHDRLMTRLSKGIGDKGLLRLINDYLKAGMMEGGVVSQRTSGTPQGGPLSPLLSNIVLDELDKELEKRGHSFCRYADDCNIFVSSRKAGERVMASIIKFIEKKLKLKVNRKKSGVRHCSEVKYLGYTILSGGDIRVADKTITRLKDKIREITKRNRGVSFVRIISELNRMIMGWTNYFHLANKWLSVIKQIEGWMRRKLRCYRLKQCGRRYPIFKFLRSLGMPESKSWNAIMYTEGWWKLSNKVVARQGMGIEWFNQQGLYSLFERMKR